MHLLFVFPGVVFNEMKGVYSQPDNILGRAAQQASSFYFFLYFYSSLSFFFLIFQVPIVTFFVI